MSELETIIATLGVERSANLFHSILPLINAHRYELLECLYNQDWDGAAQHAHKLLATGHLLGSQHLLEQLMLIEKHDTSTILELNFINQLTAEIDSGLKQLTQYSQLNQRPQ
ncbi:MAG: hypothetical protein WBP46_12100 [Thiolinea sp.]